MEIRKAVITAAGRGHRTLPLQTLVDRDGAEQKALEIILDEAVEAGVEEVCVVVTPGDQAAYREAAGPHARRLHFVEQTEPAGYGHALSLAREFVAGRPFLHLVSDHLYLSDAPETCAQQVVEAAQAGALRRLRRAGDAREPACPTTARSAAGGSAGGPTCTRSTRPGEADPERGRAAADRAGPAGRLLPVLLRHPRLHAGGHGPARRADRRPTGRRPG